MLICAIRCIFSAIPSCVVAVNSVSGFVQLVKHFVMSDTGFVQLVKHFVMSDYGSWSFVYDVMLCSYVCQGLGGSSGVNLFGTLPFPLMVSLKVLGGTHLDEPNIGGRVPSVP